MKTKVLGILFLACGIGYFGAAVDLWDFSIFFSGWWTLFLIIPGILSMLDEGIHFGNTFIVLLGVYFLGSANDWINFELSWPIIASLICIGIGLQLLLGKVFIKKTTHDGSVEEHDIKTSVFLANRRQNYLGPVQHVKAEAVFGSQLLDLSHCDLQSCEGIHLEAVFGTIDIVVSEDVHYALTSENVFGNTRIDNNQGGSIEVRVTTSAVFGNINLRKVNPYVREGQYREK